MKGYMKTVAILAFALLLTCCGRQYRAEKVIKGFLKENLVTDDYAVRISDIDSTRHVSDSALNAMKTIAVHNRMFKKGMKFGSNVGESSCFYTRTYIIRPSDTIVQTFYLDRNLSEVIAFKDN